MHMWKLCSYDTWFVGCANKMKKWQWFSIFIFQWGICHGCNLNWNLGRFDVILYSNWCLWNVGMMWLGLVIWVVWFVDKILRCFLGSMFVNVYRVFVLRNKENGNFGSWIWVDFDLKIEFCRCDFCCKYCCLTIKGSISSFDDEKWRFD